MEDSNTNTSKVENLSLENGGYASRYASSLLRGLGVGAVLGEIAHIDHPAKRWAASGLMSLTGERDGSPEFCPVPLPCCADGALSAFQALTGISDLQSDTGNPFRGGELLAERSAITSYQRNGAQSTQGHCQLLSTNDGQIAINLARDDDWALVPALLRHEGDHDWQSLGRQIQQCSTGELLSHGRELGLAIVDAARMSNDHCDWFHAHTSEQPAVSHQHTAPRIIDLSSLWAGPLCSHLWQLAGAEVIKVESQQRPDGARSGPPAFFNLLNDGKQQVVLDLHTENGRQELRGLISQADIVLEASRPRALQQMGIVAEDIVRQQPGLTWVSITGYGRQQPQSNWIAYGDDAAISAGLSAILHSVTGKWLVCGDAIADPLTGLHAALAGWANWQSGRGALLDISLEGVVSHCIAATAPPDHNYQPRYDDWCNYLSDNQISVSPPRRRFASTATWK